MRLEVPGPSSITGAHNLLCHRPACWRSSFGCEFRICHLILTLSSFTIPFLVLSTPVQQLPGVAQGDFLFFVRTTPPGLSFVTTLSQSQPLFRLAILITPLIHEPRFALPPTFRDAHLLDSLEIHLFDQHDVV